MKPNYWSKASLHLSAQDPIMAGLVRSFAHEHISHRGNALETLARSVVGQQISVKAADSIWARLEALTGAITPQSLLEQPVDALRSVGLSGQKVRYLHGIAEAFAKETIPLPAIATMPTEQAIKTLCQLPGVGRWTAEMFLIFHLHHPDILPLGDIGIIKAIQKLYGTTLQPKSQDFTNITSRWAPYRTVATWHLWRSLDPVPVQY